MVRSHSWLDLFFNSRRLNHKCSPCWFLGHEWLPQGSWHCSCFHILCFPKPCWSQTEQRRYLSSMLEISTWAQRPRETVSAPSLKVSKAAQGLEQPQLVDGMAGNGIRGFLRSLHTQTYLGFHDDSVVSSCIYFALFPLKFSFSNLDDLLKESFLNYSRDKKGSTKHKKVIPTSIKSLLIGSLFPHLCPCFVFLENLMILQFIRDIWWDYRKVCPVREPGGFRTLVSLHLYSSTRFPPKRFCERNSEFLEMDEVHIFSPLFFTYI